MFLFKIFMVVVILCTGLALILCVIELPNLMNRESRKHTLYSIGSLIAIAFVVSCILIVCVFAIASLFYPDDFYLLFR